METWIIEPRDPLIARDGRPFSATPGARASSLLFPYPSTTTGAVRTRAGSDANGVFEESQANVDAVKSKEVRGPLLVELDKDSGTIADWLLPAPADVLLLEKTGLAKEATRIRLVPLALPHGARTDFDSNYSIVGMVKPCPAKPYGNRPRFWRWKAFKQWLVNPPDEGDKTGKNIKPAELGHNGPVSETRTHIKIDPLSQTAAETFLFQTRGMEFTWTIDPEDPFKDSTEPSRLGLAIATSADNLTDGLWSLGGERRTAFWRASNESLIPDCPPELLEKIKGNKACRVVLLTPAIFGNNTHTEGWRPDEDSDFGMLKERHGVKPKLIAAALPRYQVISGWDYEHRCPKPTRRMVPAGAVYFLKLELKEANADLEEWAKSVWGSCVSDAQQDCNDGFGLTALGAWSGQPQPMEF